MLCCFLFLFFSWASLDVYSVFAFQNRWYYNYQKGLALFDNGNYDMAMFYFEQAVSDEAKPRQGIVFDLEYVDYSPYYNIAECHYLIGQRMKTGRYLKWNGIKAAQAFERCYNHNPHRPEVRQKSINRLQEIATQMEDSAQYQYALAIYTFLQQNSDFHFEGIIALLSAREFFHKKEYQRAVQEFHKAEQAAFLKLDAQDPSAVAYWKDYYMYAQALWKQSAQNSTYAERAEKILKKLLDIYLYRAANKTKATQVQELLNQIAAGGSKRESQKVTVK